MKGERFFGIGIALIVFILTFLLVSWSSIEAAPPAQDHILVKFRSGADIPAIHSANKTGTIKVISGIKVHVVSIPPGQDVQEIVERFKKNRNVEYAEPDYVVYADGFIPNDPGFSNLWGLNNTGQTGGTSGADIDAPEAWEDMNHRGNPLVRIAILDTGISNNHEDLPALKIVNQQDFTVDPPGSNPDDVYGHGTHVAGTAAAATNNGVGVAGVGFNCSLMDIKVIGDDGRGYLSWIASGITYAADNGAKVINMSLGGDNPSQTLEDAVNYAWNNGVVVVASAGNDATTNPHYPAYYDNCIAVAATDHNDAMASWSTHGSWVDVAAPGVNVYSTTLPYRSKGKTINYGYKSGTSMSAPHVSGLVGLVWADMPSGASNNDVRCQIQGTADTITGTGTNWVWGRINAYNAVTDTVNVHDVAVTKISSTLPSYFVGDVVSGKVIVQNQGTNNEAFDVTLTVDGITIMGPTSITLTPGPNFPIPYTWDTTGTNTGSHTLRADASVVNGEVQDVADNSKSLAIDIYPKDTKLMHVESITAEPPAESSVRGKTTYWRVSATVFIAENGAIANPVNGATVYGTWGGAYSANVSGMTDSDGKVIFTSNLVKNGGTFTFVITNVEGTGWIYDSNSDKVKGILIVAPSLASPALVREYPTALEYAYPSPGNPDIWIPFTLSNAEHVVIKIYSSAGQLLRTLDLGQKPAGEYMDESKAAYWDGRNEKGEKISSGIYFYVMEAGDFTATKKMIIQK